MHRSRGVFLLFFVFSLPPSTFTFRMHLHDSRSCIFFFVSFFFDTESVTWVGYKKVSRRSFLPPPGARRARAPGSRSRNVPPAAERRSSRPPSPPSFPFSILLTPTPEPALPALSSRIPKVAPSVESAPGTGGPDPRPPCCNRGTALCGKCVYI